LNGTLVDHDGKRESGMGFGCGHDQLRSLIDGVAGTVPINDHAIDAAAHHVIHLRLSLSGVGGTVADIHVVGLAEPHDHVGINFRCCAGIEQRVNVDLAYVSRALIAVRLSRKSVGGAGVVRGLRRERSRGHNVSGAGAR
jgi:hypothetical protein